FSGTMGLSEFPLSFIVTVLSILTTRALPTGQGQQRDLPGSAQDASVHAWGLRPRGVRPTPGLYFDSGGVAFRIMQLRRHSGFHISRLNTQPAPAPVNASHIPSRGIQT